MIVPELVDADQDLDGPLVRELEIDDGMRVRATIESLLQQLSRMLKERKLHVLRVVSMVDTETETAGGVRRRVVKREQPTYLLRLNGGAPGAELEYARKLLERHGYRVSKGEPSGRSES